MIEKRSKSVWSVNEAAFSAAAAGTITLLTAVSLTGTTTPRIGLTTTTASASCVLRSSMRMDFHTEQDFVLLPAQLPGQKGTGKIRLVGQPNSGFF